MLTKAILELSALADVGLVAALVVSGTVKGVLGIGLPLILVPLTTQILEVPLVVALLSVAMIVANVGQAVEGGGTMAAIRGLWPIMAALVLGTLIGVHLLVSIDRRLLDGILGAIFVALAAMLLRAPRFQLTPRTERWAGPLVGLVAGLLGGLSAMFGPPLIAYLIGRGVDPDTFVKHMAILIVAATAALLLALGGSGSLSPLDLLISAAAIIPIHLGMAIGRRLRGHVPPAVFRAAVLAVLAWGGLTMLRRALL